MTSKDCIEIIKAGVRAVVTIVFSVIWVVRVMETGDVGTDTFTLFTGGMLAWYFGESLVAGIANRITVKGKT